ncbi:hypothetical protein MKK75_29720 [Methylobacterium sp. J-030]|uniref:hypothetical protein n=1 Tax=Methylobacterium sp. J-030 TaxID=2836627 RepID=UPI001FB8AF7D|nr:hypothetical protein [Methylobacterium sp. J-030]MCJ2072923.1 hypothetical protein [Methylobacterium sp. J-030]
MRGRSRESRCADNVGAADIRSADRLRPRNRIGTGALFRKLRRSAPEAPDMLLITSLVAGTFVLAGSFSLIAVLAD